MEYSPELMQFAKESLSASEFEHFSVSMEASKMSQGTHVAFLKKLTGHITKLFRSKPTRDKLFEKSIVDSNGDITKVNNIQTSLNVLKLLQKSKEKDIKEDATMLSNYYNELKKRKNVWMKCKAMAKSADSIYEATLADILYCGVYCLGVKAFVGGVSALLVRMHNPKVYSRQGIFSLLGNMRVEVEFAQKGSLDKILNAVTNKKKTATEAIETGIIITVGLIIALITLCFSIRIFTYYFYYTRMQLSDYFEQQARFLDLHASELKKNKSMAQIEKNSIIEAQKRWAERFTALSEMIVDDDIAAVKKVSSDTRSLNKDLTTTVSTVAKQDMKNEIDVPNTGMDFF